MKMNKNSQAIDHQCLLKEDSKDKFVWITCVTEFQP